MAKRKRPWSREFPVTLGTRRYLLDGIPPGLWLRAKSKAQAAGVSMRTMILRLLTKVVKGEIEP